MYHTYHTAECRNLFFFARWLYVCMTSPQPILLPIIISSPGMSIFSTMMHPTLTNFAEQDFFLATISPYGCIACSEPPPPIETILLSPPNHTPDSGMHASARSDHKACRLKQNITGFCRIVSSKIIWKSMFKGITNHCLHYYCTT